VTHESLNRLLQEHKDVSHELVDLVDLEHILPASVNIDDLCKKHGIRAVEACIVRGTPAEEEMMIRKLRSMDLNHPLCPAHPQRHASLKEEEGRNSPPRQKRTAKSAEEQDQKTQDVPKLLIGGHIETSECITIHNRGRVYTDCMEFSLLRFLHMLSMDVASMHRTGRSGYSLRTKVNEKLRKFIKMFPTIERKVDNYLTSDERSKWATTVSDQIGIDYYRNDGAELFTSVANIFNFLRVFLSFKVEESLSMQQKFDRICGFFSTKSKKIRMSVGNLESKKERKKLRYVTALISRPSCSEYQQHLDDTYTVVTRKTEIVIQINAGKYVWHLWEVFFEEGCFANNFITGHSVITS